MSGRRRSPASKSAPQLNPSGVPLPAALPLFATGLGALGLLSWRNIRFFGETAARRSFCLCRLLLTMSAIGTKQSSPSALHMSAFDQSGHPDHFSLHYL